MSDKKEPTTERVTMLWPISLKKQVRDKVGPRALTEFTLTAVANHLSVADKQTSLEKELNETKYLAQLLADRLAMGGDYQDRREALMEVDLPSWVDTTGWPDDLAELVKLDQFEESVEPAVVSSEEPPPPPVEAAPEAAATEAVGAAAAESGVDAAKDDLLARIQAKATEKGVDLSGHGLKPASTLPIPERPEEQQAPEPELKPEPVPEPEPMVKPDTSDACPKCGETLVSGECWTCF